MHTLTQEQLDGLRPGQRIVARNPDGYEASGRLIGITVEDGIRLRILGDDRIERRIPLPVRVSDAIAG